MSKLLKLKEWVTLDEAARHIAAFAGEDVSRADVLRFGIDQQLQLSVYLVNKAQARKGRVMAADEAPFNEYPISDFPEAVKSLPPGSDQKTVRIPHGEWIGPDQLVVLEEELFSLGGVHDLPPYGSAHLGKV